MIKKFELTSIKGNLLKESLECVLEQDNHWYNANCKKLDQYGVGKTIAEAVKMLEFNIMNFYFDLRNTQKGFLNEDCKGKLRFLEDLFVERPEKPREDYIEPEKPTIISSNDYDKFGCPFMGPKEACNGRWCMMWVFVGENKGRCGLVNAPFAVSMCATSCEG